MATRVCLSMIVRNEAHVIARCLDAARPAFDAVVVCDTGSTDNTPAIVEQWLARTGVPGRVHRHGFVDFAHNRTRAIEEARDAARGLGWDLECTYLLFLDADMVLEVGPGFRRDDLRADSYRVLQRNGSLRYPNVRLARASLDCRYVGATHEHFAGPAGAREEPLDSLEIDDRNDGGSRADKYARDERLLAETLRRDPGNVRAMFYLAQTYRGMGEPAKALVWYRRRAEAGGWEEEAWYAQYAIGLILLESGKPRDARRAMIAALRRDPRRPEPYAHLATFLRDRGHHRWAVRAARAGLALGVPRDRLLFVDREICDWTLLRELSIAAYYTPEWETGFEANEYLGLGIGAPPHVADLARQNAAFYAQPLPAVHIPIQPALPWPFAPCNPSIARTEDGYLLNCRAVSYRIDAYQRYAALEPDGILRTRNVFIPLDRGLQAVDQSDVTGGPEPIRVSPVQGFEDCRIVRTPERVFLTCTTTDQHPAGAPRMSLLTVSARGAIDRHVPLTGYDDELAQKNWLPFASPDGLRVVYSYAPFIVLDVDEATGVCRPVLERAERRPFDAFRGSAGPVDLPAEAGGGKLLIVHQVAFHHRRYYLHRFLRVDDEWRVTAASRPFYFLSLGIEFACGACLSHEGDLILTFGREDREAWLCRVRMDTIAEMLRPLPDWPPGRTAGPQD